MDKTLVLAGYRLAFALIVLVAIAAQLVHGLAQNGNFSTVNFFSFFTIESNVFGAAVFLGSAVYSLRNKSSEKFDYLRGAATLYMVITGVVYVLLLSGADVQTSLQWVNIILHYLFPIGILLDWLIDRPSRLSIKKSLLWLTFPVAYLVYSLLRGPFAHHWYPYPFINVAQYGYGRVALNSIVIAAGFLVLTLVIAALGRRGSMPKRN